MEVDKVVSCIGAVVVSMIIGAFVPYDCPELVRVPEDVPQYVVKRPKAERV